MREIKFRAWDEQTKKYWAIDRWHVRDEYIDLIPVGVSVSDPNIERIWRHTRDLILEQYTGVKDQNDIELYEGDIVRAWGHRCGANDELHEVVFDQGCFCWERGFTFPVPLQLLHDAELKVFGNIHENQELLGGE